MQVTTCHEAAKLKGAQILWRPMFSNGPFNPNDPAEIIAEPTLVDAIKNFHVAADAI